MEFLLRIMQIIGFVIMFLAIYSFFNVSGWLVLIALPIMIFLGMCLCASLELIGDFIESQI